MKVFNLTDVPTPTLAQYGMENHTISVAKQALAPGASIEVDAKEEAVERAHLEHFLARGASAIDEPPASYTAGAKKKKAAPPSEKASTPEMVAAPLYGGRGEAERKTPDRSSHRKE
jgi:hypothetical protein